MGVSKSFADSNLQSDSRLSLSRVLMWVIVVWVVVVSTSGAAELSDLNFRSSKSDQIGQVSRAGQALKKPLVILISSDGFRWGYQWKVPTPNIDRLRINGTEAFPGMIPVYPSVTFSNHYSIATGLYPAWHGIISNKFRDPGDPSRRTFFRKNDTNPKWWLGEPIWETVTKNGLRAATHFWPGSEVIKGSWKCPPAYCWRYNESEPFLNRVDTVLKLVDLRPSKRPSFIAVYFESPDDRAHFVGPDDPQISEAVATIDAMVGRLLDGLNQRGILQDVHVIMVSDHGMVGTCDSKMIYLEELAPWIQIPEEWIDTLSPVLAIRPPPGVDLKRTVSKINEGLTSGKVGNGQYLKVYLKQDLPSRLVYFDNDRIQPIIGMVSEGYTVQMKRSDKKGCGGDHGYDNAYASMRSIFIGHGPRFPRGIQVPSFVNVEVYNVITAILGINGAPTNGTKSFAQRMLLPM